MSSRSKRTQKSKSVRYTSKANKTQIPRPRNAVVWSEALDSITPNRVKPLRSITESEHVKVTNKRPVEIELPAPTIGAHAEPEE